MDVSMRRGVSIRLLTHEVSQSGTSLPSTGQPVTHSDSFLVGLRAGLMKKKGCGRGAGCKPYPSLCAVLLCTLDSSQHTHTEIERSPHIQLWHIFFDVRIIFKMSLGSWKAASATGSLEQEGSEASSSCQSARTSNTVPHTSWLQFLTHSNVKTENTFKCQWERSLN